MFLFVYCLMLRPFGPRAGEFYAGFLFCWLLLGIISSLAIILLGTSELVAWLNRVVVVCVLCVFLTMQVRSPLSARKISVSEHAFSSVICRNDTTQYVNWNKHPVPVPPSSRLIHYELQHPCVTRCRKSWCESCWYSCNCEGPPIKFIFP